MKLLASLILTCFLSGLTFAQNALHFDGSNDFVQTSAPGVVGPGDRTFEAWLFVSVNAPASNLAITDYGLNAAGSRNTFLVTGNRALGFLSGGTNANLISPAGAVPVGQWVHVAFVLQNGTGYLYVDGVQVDTGNLSNVNTPFGNQSLTIGQRVTGGSLFFDGSMDEVRIWNVARSAAQLNDFRNVEFCSNPPGLVSYYKMNEGVAGGTNTGIAMTVDEVSGNNGSLSPFALTGSTSNFVAGVTMTTSHASTQTLDGCEGFTVAVGGNTYDSTGIYVDTLTAVLSGCDSVVTTDLTIRSGSATTQVLNECAGFSVAVDTNTYNSTGIYVDTLTSILSGCDSIVTTDLTIDTLDISTSVSGITITAGQSGVTYAWIDCDNGNVIIQGAGGQSYTPTQNGNYAVVLNNGLCTDTSACVPVTVVGIDDWETSEIKLFPVPSTDFITIQWEKFEHFSISIANSMGQKILNVSSEGDARRIDISALPSGVYFVEIDKDERKLRRKFVKH